MKTRMRYLFTGCVQGVGFRFRAYHAASALGLTGWVRNEYDGSVTIEVQGERHSIDTMLAMIEKGRFINIDRVDSEEISIVTGENSFEICG